MSVFADKLSELRGKVNLTLAEQRALESGDAEDIARCCPDSMPAPAKKPKKAKK